MPQFIYKQFTISFDPKPIPDRRFDWDFQHVDYDGAPDSGDFRCGSAKSVAACQDLIDDILEDWPNS